MVKGSLKNPYLAVIGALTVILLGGVAMSRIPTDILPRFRTPAVQILTLYPGMPAEVMERDVTSRLERWTGQANGVAQQESRSLTGVSVVRDYFRPDIDPNTAMSQVSSLAISDLYYLPPGTIPPMVMPFDPTAFFFEELRISAERLLREVHVLAFYYHWSESEILGLERDRRRAYLALLSDTLRQES